ncbi:methyl-accepting chemotaxis protein [Methanospirillum sp.]
MTTHLRDILIHILSDDPQGTNPELEMSGNPEDNEILSSFLTKKQELLQTKSRMDAIFAHSPQPILILTPDAKISDFNRSFQAISGYALEDWTGKPVQSIFPGFRLPEDGFSNTNVDSEIFTIDFSTGTRVLEQYPIPVTNSSGTLTEIILIFKDITIRVQAEQKAEEIRQKLAHDYGERVKEQRLFYNTASLIQDDSRSIQDILSEIAVLIPPGWQYPEETAARIQYRGEMFQTQNFKETPWIQKATFIPRTGNEGIIEVVYLNEKPQEYEGPFLLEERNLINSLAEMLKTYVDRKEGELELAKKMHDLGERVKEQQLFYKTASLIQDDSRSIQDILGEIAVLIPPGWQYPEETAARIQYRGEMFQTRYFKETPWIQKAIFKPRTGNEGIIEVVYLNEKPQEHEGPFLLEERNLINSLAEMLKTYVDRKEGELELAKKMHDLGERVKEQQLFYKTSSLIQDDSKNIAQVLQDVVMLIPPGWQYPEVTEARIQYGNGSFKTTNFKETGWIQTSSFVTRTGTKGTIDIVYLIEKPPEHEGPFLLEERNLINSLADMLKTYIDRKEGEQEIERRMVEIEELEHLNNTIVQQIPMPVLLIDENQQILVTNDAYIKLTGYTKDELLHMTPRDITVVEYTGEGLKELLSSVKPTFGELTCKFPLGVRILEQYGIPIFSRSGALENYLIVYNDITERKRNEEEVQKLLTDSRTMSEVLSKSAEDLETGMARMAEGDLKFRALVMDHDPLFNIKTDYNTALQAISLLIQELEGSISHLTGTTEKTLSQTDNIKNAIRDIAEEVQSSTTGAREQMEETRRISDDIRLLSERISQIVDITSRLMALATQTAQQGVEAGQIGGIANEKMESVGKISAASKEQITGLNEQMAEIDKIVRLISDISSQTNLLALNAAIEAARAGEHGRGFAVVAQEVKNLAGQSKIATAQIEDLIRAIQTKSADTVTSIEAAYTEIQEGIASVNKTIEALSSITSQVTEISDGISQVTNATQDEELLMHRVQEGIEVMNSESEKNLARMEEISRRMDESRKATDDIAASSHEIARQSEHLKKQADRFIV